MMIESASAHTSIDDARLRHRRGAFEAGTSTRRIAFNPLGLTSRPPLAGALPSSASPTTVRGSLGIFFSLLIAAFLIFDLSDKATYLNKSLTSEFAALTQINHE